MSTENITDRKLFSERLKTLRGTRNKAQFSKELGIHAPVYQRYEDGRVPNHDNLSVISGKCGVTVDWLLGREDSHAPDQLRTGVYEVGKGSAKKTETPGNIEDSAFRDRGVMTLEKGRGLADYPRMEPMAKDEAALSNARQLIATMKEREDGDRLLGQLATMLMWLNAAILPDMEADVKATALRQAHLVCDKLGGVPSPSA